MASVVYNEFKRALAAGEIDFDAPNDIRVALLMTNTTADTENDTITTVTNFTTLDEFDGSGYSSPGIALTGETVTRDDGNDRAEFDANDAAFGALGAGTRAVQGVLVYKFITALSSSMPLAFIQFSGNITMDGSSFTIVWDAQGIIQIT